MAVTTTPEELMEAAYAKSMKNSPGQIASESTELLQVVIRTLRKFYSIAARVNPLYFADQTVVAAPGAAQPWPRPEGAESVFYITDSSGDEVVVVPFDDRTAESGKAAVYRVGKNYYSAGNANDPDPATDALTFWLSPRPTDPADFQSAISADWEEAYNELIVLELAAYLAKKDAGTTGRDVELTHLAEERDEWLRLFIMFLEHETANEVRRFGHVKRINIQTLVPLNDLLIGGTTVKIDRGGN
jgi:hypothetical protein